MSLIPSSEVPEHAIAIIGMAGRFPGAPDIDTFWTNLLQGKDTVQRFASPDAAGQDYVAARGVLADADMFDAEYFGITPRDAERLDPQHRVLLEVAATALEHAGYSSQQYEGEIGLFAGCSLNTYLLENLCGDRDQIEKLTRAYQVGEFATALGNDKDFLTTRIAYKLNLRGPCLTVQSACATSLVAIAQAAQALLNGQCSMALAGGVSITFPQERGHVAQDGSLMSGDGTCRPFDKDASGTVFGHGAGIVVLKRLEDAIADGDTVHAVLRGFAVNNDGAQKVGYMAPGVAGQMRVIQAAQEMAGVTPAEISYIEAHGTGTPMGDPIEVGALTEVFRASTDAENFCAIGSAKGNVGHLDCAAGVTGVIKTVMSLKHRTLPRLAHFTAPNTALPMQGSPFYFPATNGEWKAAGPLRAGVSAFGVGGVNAHVVLEEAPAVEPRQHIEDVPVALLLSARTPDALASVQQQLAAWLEANPSEDLRDVAFTLASGRTPQKHRAAVVATDAKDAVTALREGTASHHAGTAAVEMAAMWMAGRNDAAERIAPARRIPLPTYPFQRQRYWIDPPVRGSESKAETADVKQPVAENAEAVQASRVEDFTTRISAVLFDLSGIAIQPEESTLSFLELGFDSLFLTQATTELEKAFGVKVTFRQLMEDFDSVAALAKHLDETVPFTAPVTKTESVAQQDGPVPAMLQEQIANLSKMFADQIDALRKVAGMEPLQTAQPAAPKPLAAAAHTALPPVRHGAFRLPETRSSHEVDPKQSAYLTDLIARYIAKTPTSKQLTADARGHLADPRAVAGFRPHWKEMVYPLVTNRAQGSRLWDVDGNEYIDLVNGYGCIFFGHSPQFVVDAAMHQLQTGVAIGPQSVLAGEVARMFAEMTGNERVTFCNTGSEAVMAAMRVARCVTGRDRVVYFSGDYHGTFDEVLLRETPRGALPIAPGIPVANVGNVTVLPYGTPESLEWLRANADTLAAVLIEPVQTRHPENQPLEFIREARRITEESGTALILDEVVTGFRLAPGGFQEFSGVRADLCTYGKVLGGGHPLGVLSGKAKFMDVLDGGAWQYGDSSAPEVGMTFFAGTFVRHPQALAVAKAVLTYLKAAGPELQKSINGKAATLAERVNAMFAQHNVPYKTYGFASWFYIALPSEWRLAPLFYYAMRARGIHIQEGYPCFLTTAHTDEDLATVETAFRETIEELAAAGILPAATSTPPDTPTHLPMQQDEQPRSAPMTEPQREVFLAAHLSDEANCAFNESLTLRLHGPVKQDALRFALDAVFARHDALRSVIAEDGETLNVSPVFTGEIEFLDLSEKAEAEQAEVIAQRIHDEGARPFDLHKGPLARVVCYRQSAQLFTVVLTAHHIVMDGWSSNQILEDIATVYSGGTAALQALPPAMRFSSYAVRERERTEAGEFASNEAFWLEKYKGRDPQLNLPTDRRRPPHKTYAGATLTGTLDTGLIGSVRKLGAKSGCSMFVTTLSAFQMLLHRLCQQNEVVVGISTAAQALNPGQSLVGHCVNFLPMLSELAPGESVEAHLKATRRAMLDAQDHQEYTFGSLLHKLQLQRDSSRLPLIEVQFNLEKMGVGLQFDGLRVETESNAKRFVNTDLFLNVTETPDGVRFTCDYNTDLFDERTVARWMNIWQTMMANAAADGTQPIATLPMLPDAERELVLNKWNRTATNFGAFAPVTAMVLEEARSYPHSIAAECNGRTWTYRELVEYSTTIAQRLCAEGVRKGDLVGICIERSLEMLGAVLAVMLAGAAYVPLDPRNPQKRLDAIFANAELAVLLTGRDPKITFGGKRINITGPQPDHRSVALPTLSAESLAYVIYTSGSTGVPKGVAIQQNALRNLLLSMQRQPGFRSTDALLSVTTLSFDIAQLELLLPLICGGRVIVATDDEATDGTQLRRLLRHTRATVMQATPGLWSILLESGWNGEHEGGTPALKMLCGGEALGRELADRLIATGGELWNMYGPTETTIWSSATRVLPGTASPRVAPPIANTQFYVLDAAGQPAPIGVSGELYIGGEGLALGYWHREEQTIAAFVPNPFGTGRLYRTGDLARWFADGSMEILGRVDFQVKVRGHRIELSEIEAALCSADGVNEAIVLQIAGADGSSSLAAFLTGRDGSLPDLAEVWSTARRLLPEYMLPRDMYPLGAMPRTANGKIDRKALPALAAPQQQPALTFTAPATEEETRLERIWSELLGVPNVSTTATVFELGADSLVVFRMAARCQREGIPLRAAQILEHRTIQAIARLLSGTPAATAAVTEKVRIQVAPRQKYVLQREAPRVQ